MKLLFQIIAFVGIGSITIFFALLGIIQNKKLQKNGYFRHLFVPLTESEEKLYKIGGIFLLAGLAFMVVSVIYHCRYGLN